MASFAHADIRIGKDGKVTCKACGVHLGSHIVYRVTDETPGARPEVLKPTHEAEGLQEQRRRLRRRS